MSEAQKKCSHYRNIETNEDLQRAHKLLSDGKWHSTRAVIRGAHVCAVNTVVDELRKNGFDIQHRQVSTRHEYRLLIEGQLGVEA